MIEELRWCAEQLYPCNAEMWALLARAEMAGHMASRLRRTLAAACTACPASLVALLAYARCTAALPASGHRVEVSRPHDA